MCRIRRSSSTTACSLRRFSFPRSRHQTRAPAQGGEERAPWRRRAQLRNHSSPSPGKRRALCWSSGLSLLRLSPLPLVRVPSFGASTEEKGNFASCTPSCCWISESGTSTSATPLDRGRGRSLLPPYVCEIFEVLHVWYLLSRRLRQHQDRRQAVRSPRP